MARTDAAGTDARMSAPAPGGAALRGLLVVAVPKRVLRRAVDRNATFAVACWDEATDGLFLPELGLRAPFFAEPVRRGQTRTRPGDIRPAAGPLALVGTAAPELAFCAFGASDAYDVLRQAVDRFVTDGERIERHGEATLFALSHTNGTASAIRV